MKESCQQAGRRIHRRADRPQGPTHGTRGSDHLGLLRNRGGEARRVRGRWNRRDAAAGRRRRPAPQAIVRLTDLLNERRVVVPLPAASLEEGLRLLVDACAADGRVSDLRLPRSGDQRELARRHDDTGALMHGCPTSVPTRCRPWSWPSESPKRRSRARATRGPFPRMILLIVAPPKDASAYLQTVAAFARALSLAPVADGLLAAQTPAAALALEPLREIELEGQLVVRDIMDRRISRLHGPTKRSPKRFASFSSRARRRSGRGPFRHRRRALISPRAAQAPGARIRSSGDHRRVPDDTEAGGQARPWTPGSLWFVM